MKKMVHLILLCIKDNGASGVVHTSVLWQIKGPETPQNKREIPPKKLLSPKRFLTLVGHPF